MAHRVRRLLLSAHRLDPSLPTLLLDDISRTASGEDRPGTKQFSPARARVLGIFQLLLWWTVFRETFSYAFQRRFEEPLSFLSNPFADPSISIGWFGYTATVLLFLVLLPSITVRHYRTTRDKFGSPRPPTSTTASGRNFGLYVVAPSVVAGSVYLIMTGVEAGYPDWLVLFGALLFSVLLLVVLAAAMPALFPPRPTTQEQFIVLLLEAAAETSQCSTDWGLTQSALMRIEKAANYGERFYAGLGRSLDSQGRRHSDLRNWGVQVGAQVASTIRTHKNLLVQPGVSSQGIAASLINGLRAVKEGRIEAFTNDLAQEPSDTFWRRLISRVVIASGLICLAVFSPLASNVLGIDLSSARPTLVLLGVFTLIAPDASKVRDTLLDIVKSPK